MSAGKIAGLGDLPNDEQRAFIEIHISPSKRDFRRNPGAKARDESGGVGQKRIGRRSGGGDKSRLNGCGWTRLRVNRPGANQVRDLLWGQVETSRLRLDATEVACPEGC